MCGRVFYKQCKEVYIVKKINKDGIDVRIMQLRNSKCGLIFTRFYINYMGDELHVYGFMKNY